MSEFIGSRISLISKSDIRYVGTLHEINSENSTVALENVKSYGTEGRRPGNEIAGSDSVYEYIVFRGSDVKDLRIEETPKESKPQPPPQVPNDPAILGTSARPQNSTEYGGSYPQHPQNGGEQQPPAQFQQGGQYFPNQRFGPGGAPPHFTGPQGQFPGYPGMPYGPPPPGWHPPPGQGFPYPGPFPGGRQPPFNGAHPAMNQHVSGQPPQNPGQFASTPTAEAPADTKAVEKSASQKTTSAPPATAPTQAPPLPVNTKPDVASALANAPASKRAGGQAAQTGGTSGRIQPAIPLPSKAKNPPGAGRAAQANSPMSFAGVVGSGGDAAADAKLQYHNSTAAATAAVAAAMAKLPPAPGQIPKGLGNQDAMDNLTRKVNELRADGQTRYNRQGGPPTGHRGSRGGPRRGGREQNKGIEVPNTDFDFATANAQFNKQDLVREAIASGSPSGTPGDKEKSLGGGSGQGDGADDVTIPAAPASYNKASSFFDNISSEAKDREEAAERRKQSGSEFRNEERRKNLETFGLGSVDSNRTGFRGRGRGRGGYGRGRGQAGGGRGGYRGTRPPGSDAGIVPAQS